MSWTALWAGWALATLASFFAIEVPAVRRKLPGPDTLTDHVRWMFALDRRDRPAYVWRRLAFFVIFVGGPAGLVAHFVGYV